MRFTLEEAFVKRLVKTFFLWLKTYWHVPLILIAFITIFVFAKEKAKSLKKVLQVAIETYKKDKEILEKIAAEEKRKKEIIQKEYDLAIENLEKKYEEERKEVKLEEKKRIKELTKLYSHDKEKLDLFLQDEFGLTEVRR